MVPEFEKKKKYGIKISGFDITFWCFVVSHHKIHKKKCRISFSPHAEATLGQYSAHSLATGPVTTEPLSSPLGLTMTPALSSK
jgi:hypothetical protein